jgi:hypothetical protein
MKKHVVMNLYRSVSGPGPSDRTIAILSKKGTNPWLQYFLWTIWVWYWPYYVWSQSTYCLNWASYAWLENCWERSILRVLRIPRMIRNLWPSHWEENIPCDIHQITYHSPASHSTMDDLVFTRYCQRQSGLLQRQHIQIGHKGRRREYLAIIYQAVEKWIKNIKTCILFPCFSS